MERRRPFYTTIFRAAVRKAAVTDAESSKQGCTTVDAAIAIALAIGQMGGGEGNKLRLSELSGYQQRPRPGRDEELQLAAALCIVRVVDFWIADVDGG